MDARAGLPEAEKAIPRYLKGRADEPRRRGARERRPRRPRRLRAHRGLVPRRGPGPLRARPQPPRTRP
ncbi:MAG: hypothetical protein MZV63_09795 [Marinilabiliales bacterium]|nr:hypothetical protein [Marinilabiliales bacterium]